MVWWANPTLLPDLHVTTILLKLVPFVSGFGKPYLDKKSSGDRESAASKSVSTKMKIDYCIHADNHTEWSPAALSVPRNIENMRAVTNVRGLFLKPSKMENGLDDAR
jgi:hypothetical protein